MSRTRLLSRLNRLDRRTLLSLGCLGLPALGMPSQSQGARRVKMPTGPVVVRGLGRYLELKEMAKRQADEKRDREEKAFMVKGATQRGGRDSEGRAYTVPEPFALSYRTQRAQRTFAGMIMDHICCLAFCLCRALAVAAASGRCGTAT